MDNAIIVISGLSEVENSESQIVPTPASLSEYYVALPGNNSSLKFHLASIDDLSLVANDSFFGTSSYTSMITNGATVGNATLARGRLTGTREADDTPLEFETFSGWLSGSVFGTTQIAVGASGNEREQYRFISYSVGVISGSAPSATGTETSATWEGATVATVKADRTFMLGDAGITVNFTDTDVDLMFDNWRGLDNQAVSGMSAITYQNLTLNTTNGSFRSTDRQVQGIFYGTGHTEVGGYFNTMSVAGAFGGTRQTQ